jgi:hypothetical protein
VRDDGTEPQIFRGYRALADARRGVLEKLSDPAAEFTEKERQLLRGERNRLTAEMRRLDAKIAEAAAIAVIG